MINAALRVPEGGLSCQGEKKLSIADKILAAIENNIIYNFTVRHSVSGRKRD
jgi:hypothetical protein